MIRFSDTIFSIISFLLEEPPPRRLISKISPIRYFPLFNLMALS